MIVESRPSLYERDDHAWDEANRLVGLMVDVAPVLADACVQLGVETALSWGLQKLADRDQPTLALIVIDGSNITCYITASLQKRLAALNVEPLLFDVIAAELLLNELVDRFYTRLTERVMFPAERMFPRLTYQQRTTTPRRRTTR